MFVVGSTGTTSVLLVVDPFEEAAKRVETHLRNAGHKVRAVWITDPNDLEQHLQRTPADLMFASDRKGAPPLKRVLEATRRFAPTLPVIALTDTLSPETQADAVAQGARDLVSDASPEALAHLERIYRREIVAHQHLRDLARTRAQLADYESRYAQLIAGTGDAVAHIYEGILSQVNPAFATLLGHDDPADLAGTPLMDMVAPDHQPSVKEHLKQLHNGKGDGKSLECWLLNKEGGKVSVCAQLTRGEANGERFIEMLIRAEATQPAAVAAPDTNGRLAFFEALAVPSVTNQPRAALFAVVDAFSSLEDRVGFDDAELVIQQAFAALRTRLQSHDGLFRFSTSEFAMLVTRADALEFERLADVVVKDLGAQVFSTPDHEAQISLTITVYPVGGSEPRDELVGELVREARKLSARGGNRRLVLGATGRANAQEREDQGKAEAIKKAIEQNRMKLAYQTIASLEGDTRQHFDVLVRMVNEAGEEMHASEFIRTAEKYGLMRAIDRWVVGRALKVVATREARSDASMLFVKLSEDTLKDAEAFLAWLHEGLKGRPLGEDEICFEIQELVLQNHIRKAKVLTKVLRDTGAGVAIEHFGVGANSAQLIEHLPVNFLKFHASFTASFGEKEIQKKMSSLMEMAKMRRIKTIVSHVEDANIMARMWQMGVNYIQGYHIQEPEVVMLAEEITRK